MVSQARFLQKSIVEGKVFKRGATWKKLEKFFGKSREVILAELSSVASEEEVKFLIEQINANQYYVDNIRIIDPACMQNGNGNVLTFLSLNSKLYSIEGIEKTEVGKELLELNALKVFSQPENFSFAQKFKTEDLSEKEVLLFGMYEHFKFYGKKVLILTPNQRTAKRAATYGIETAIFDDFEK